MNEAKTVDEEFIRGIEAALQVPSGSLNGTESLTELKELDSMAIVEVMAFIDEKYGVSLFPKAFRECGTLADLFQLVSNLSNK
jgi:acyl carrier protein